MRKFQTFGFVVAVALVAMVCSVADAGCGCRARAVVGAVVERVHNIQIPVLRFRSCQTCQDSATPVSAKSCDCASGGNCSCAGSCHCSPCNCEKTAQSVQPAAVQVCENGVCQVRQVDVWHHGPVASAVRAVASLAQQRAEIAASRRLKGMAGHVGQVSGYFEGVGFSTYSSDAAIRNCCFWGQRTPIEIGVARGPDGWYACVHYR